MTTYNYDLMVTTAVVSIYQVPGWPTLANTLQALWEGSTDPSRYPSNQPSVQGQQTVQVLAVKCAESPNPRNPDLYAGFADIATQRAGAVGPYWVWLDAECAAWPATATDQYTGPWNTPTANPILVVNNTTDPATPYFAAVAGGGAIGQYAPADHPGLWARRWRRPEHLRQQLCQRLFHQSGTAAEGGGLPAGRRAVHQHVGL